MEWSLPVVYEEGHLSNSSHNIVNGNCLGWFNKHKLLKLIYQTNWHSFCLPPKVVGEGLGIRIDVFFFQGALLLKLYGLYSLSKSKFRQMKIVYPVFLFVLCKRVPPMIVRQNILAPGFPRRIYVCFFRVLWHTRQWFDSNVGPIIKWNFLNKLWN